MRTAVTSMAALLLAMTGGCAPPGPGSGTAVLASAEVKPDRFAIVATERGPRGGRLVWIDEQGRRMSELTSLGADVVRDVGASWSPDGRWIAFESSRERGSLAATSLWIIRAERGARPHRLTRGPSVDRDIAWTPDSAGLLFASLRRDAGNFDIYRVGLSLTGNPSLAGKPVRVTDSADNEFHPSVASDGQFFAYQRASDEAGSTIWIRGLDGSAPRQVTSGPADLTPALSPNGGVIAFVRGRQVTLPNGGKRIDTDLFVVAASGGEPTLVVPNPFADEHGPRWSLDGRHLFATTIYRAVNSDKAVLGSITYVDLIAKPRDLRVLHDPAVVTTRTGVALSPAGLDAGQLATNDVYRQALYRVLRRHAVRKDDAAP